MFYPEGENELRSAVRTLLEEAEGVVPIEEPLRRPRALIAPHAGYVYSGPVAASAYARLRPVRDVVRRVTLLGPAHTAPVRALALPGADAFSTPLGEVALDRDAVGRLAERSEVEVSPRAHAQEHCLEVQLPFLQMTLDDFTIVPLVVGDATPTEVADVLESVWDGTETLVVISSDLSHYRDYDTARRLDRTTARAIETLRSDDLAPESACGRTPIAGLLEVARRRGLAVHNVDLRSSGDTAGPRDRVVGYGAWVIG
jgi:AmmeMemoRadiSam system protein B